MRVSKELLTAVKAGEVDLLAAMRDDTELYAELALRIQTKAGTLVPFVYNATQQVMAKRLREIEAQDGFVRVCLLKARQWGGSTLVAAELFKQAAMFPNQHAKVIAHTAEAAEKLLQMYQRFYANLPEELQPMKRYKTKSELTFANDSNDSDALRANPGLGSSLGVYSAKAAGAGRGSTLRHLHCSEVAFWGDTAGETMLGLMNTVPSSGDAAAGTTIIVESTANGIGNYFYNLYHRAKRHAPGERFRAIFLPWYLHGEYAQMAPDGFRAQLTAYERDLLEVEHPSWEFDNPATGKKTLSIHQVYWRRLTLSTQCENDENRFKQEYPLTDEEAFIASGQNFFDLEAVQARIDYVTAKVEPVFRGDLEVATVKGDAGRRRTEVKLLANEFGGRLTCWKLVELKKAYVFFADVGEGLKDSDFSVMDVYDRKTGEQVAQWRGQVAPDQFGQIIFDLGHYYNWAFGAPEVNNHGLTCLYTLRDLGYRNMYKRTLYDVSFGGEREQEGWLTSSRTRPLMLDSLRRMFREGELLVNSIVTLEEMKTFIKEGAKYQAQDGCNDDCVMAAAGASQMLTELPKSTSKKIGNYLAEPGERMLEYRKPKKHSLDPWTGRPVPA